MTQMTSLADGSWLGWQFRYLLKTRLSWLVYAVFFFALVPARTSAREIDAGLESMKRLSLDELLSLQVTTMSRKDELWWAAPGAIEVLTGEEIRRSTAQNLPEALRLATAIDVAQSSARNWAVSTRGFNVLAANKISVLLDGRSLYTPFFAGVQWDAQDTMLEDIDRIEVVSGPVGALWGSFAVNGFVQIVTKAAEDTQGLLVSAGAGTEDPGFLSMRYGGKIGQRTAYRAYAKYSETDWTYLPNGKHAQPSTDFFQTGFRIDSQIDTDTSLTFQGDTYTNKGLPREQELSDVSGGNLLAHFRKSFATDSDLDVLTYFDRTYRLIPTQWREARETMALNAKIRIPTGSHDFLIGTDLIVSRDDIGQLGFATFDPLRRTIHTAGLFLQDTIALIPGRTALTIGLKGEHNSFSGFEVQPSVRAAWTPSGHTTLWAAISRAVRAPVRVDHDLLFEFAGVPIVQATDDFKSETVVAYEIGWRRQPSDTITLDVATFYNVYDNLRTTEPLGTAPMPITFKNGLTADSYGVETTVMYQPFARMFFKLSYRYLDLKFTRIPSSRASDSAQNEANDPQNMASISAHATLPWNLEMNVAVRYVDSRPDPVTESYTVADVRIGWAPSRNWDIALIGRNLFTGLHRELVTPNSLNELIRPSGTLKVTWRF